MIIQDGMRAHARGAGGRLLLHHPDERELPASRPCRQGAEAGHPQGHVPVAGRRQERRRRACSCSAAARSCAKSIAAAELLEKDFGVAADIWSAPSFNELRRDGIDAERWNLLHPTEPPRMPLRRRSARRPRRARSIAATDYMRDYADQIRAVHAVAAATRCSAPTASAAATTARSCASFFEVDRYYVAVAALKALADEGAMPAARWPRRSRSTASTPTSPIRWTPESRIDKPRRATSMALIEVKVPDIGDFKDVPVIEVLVKPGDTVKAERSLVSLESDKATMDVPVAARRRREGGGGQGRRQGQRRAALIADARRRGAARRPQRRPQRRREPAAAERQPRRPAPAQRAGAASADRCRVPDIGDFKDVPVIEVLVKPGDTREGGGAAGHARVRQGDDGRAGAARRRGRGDQGQGRRQGQRRAR